MRLPSVLAWLIFVCLARPPDAVCESAKRQEVQEVVRIVGELNSLAMSQATTSEDSIRAAVVRTIASTKNPLVLARLAVVTCALAYPQNVNDMDFDLWFDAGYDECMHRLAEMPGLGVADAMAGVARFIQLDGGMATRFHYAVTYQKELTARIRKRRTVGPSETRSPTHPTKSRGY